MPTGTVKFFNEEKGFGFIINSGSGEQIFVHKSGLIDNVREGDAVSFEIEQGKKGPVAAKVKKA